MGEKKTPPCYTNFKLSIPLIFWLHLLKWARSVSLLFRFPSTSSSILFSLWHPFLLFVLLFRTFFFLQISSLMSHFQSWFSCWFFYYICFSIDWCFVITTWYKVCIFQLDKSENHWNSSCWYLHFEFILVLST